MREEESDSSAWAFIIRGWVVWVRLALKYAGNLIMYNVVLFSTTLNIMYTYVVPWETYLKVTPKLFEITYQNVQIVCQVLSNNLGFSATTAVPIHMYMYLHIHMYTMLYIANSIKARSLTQWKVFAMCLTPFFRLPNQKLTYIKQ